MKNLLAAMMLIIATSATAQFQGISIGADGGILFSQFAESRTGNAGYSTALRIEIPFGGFAISTGIEKTNFGKQYNYTDLRTGGEDDPSYPILDVTRFDYSYVSIPLRVKYQYQNFYAQAGVKWDRFQSMDPVSEGILHEPAYLDKPNRDIAEVRSNNLTTEFSLGFQASHPRHKNVSIYFEPTVQYITKSIYENVELDNDQLAFGMRLGAKYTFTPKGK